MLKTDSKFRLRKSYGKHKAGDTLIVGVQANHPINPDRITYWIMNRDQGIKGVIHERILRSCADRIAETEADLNAILSA